MGKRRTPTELEELDKLISQGKTVFFADIVVALGCDVEALVTKAQNLRTKLALNLSANQEKVNATHP